MSEIIEQAKKKLAEEEKNFTGNQFGQVVYKDLSKTLQQFCEKEWFAEAIMKSNKTLSDCCKTILSGVNGGISDVETYKRAVEFYVPGSTVKCQLSVCRSWDEAREPTGGVLSLLDLI
jgi:hypothetical protein